MSTHVPSSHLDLLAGANLGILATLGTPDTPPQVTAVWYLWEDDQLKFSLHDSRQKFKNLRARALATLLVVDPANPGRTIEVRGRVASIEPDPDYQFADRLVAHYGGGLDLRDLDEPGSNRHAVTITPTKINVLG